MDKGSNDINQFSAEDIRRYHAGESPAHEMHAMEKAALEDPFLADAIEGYKNTSTPKEDIEYLRNKLAAKVQDKEVVLLPAKSRSVYTHLKVAALALLLAGAGWVIYQFSLPKENDVALNKTEIKESDSVQSTAPALASDSIDSRISIKEKETTSIAPGKKITGKNTLQDQSSQIPTAQKTEDARDVNRDVASVQTQTAASPSMANRTSERLSAANVADSATVFKGRIVNSEDKPVPYATINIPEARRNILADAQGNFSIATPDSTLKASVNAVGYQTNRLNLNNPQENYKVVLQEANQSLQEVVVTGVQQSKKEMARQAGRIVSDVQPVDGFEEYNQYLLDNIKGQKGKNKKTIKGEVVLMFDVNDKGDPVNIIVQKSLCSACDEEAIRLLKEGPKWQKKQDKKGRIVIKFARVP